MTGMGVNIKSSTIEKGLEIAKDFLGKLIIPSVEEIGLLLKEKLTLWRFNNQVRIFVKAKEICEKHKIKPKTISLKLLFPLLEYSNLEEDEILQDKWANMLVNMVDSENNLQNHIFPYILSQISIEEFNELEILTDKEKKHSENYELIKDFWTNKQLSFNEADKKFKEINKEIHEIEQGGFWLDLEEFERANLLRLGLIRQLPPKIKIEESNTGRKWDEEEEWHQEAYYDSNDYGYRITELGQRFFNICEFNGKKADDL